MAGGWLRDSWGMVEDMIILNYDAHVNGVYSDAIVFGCRFDPLHWHSGLC